MDDSLAGKLLPGCNTITEIRQRILERCKEVEKTAIEQATDNAILDQLGKVMLTSETAFQFSNFGADG